MHSISIAFCMIDVLYLLISGQKNCLPHYSSRIRIAFFVIYKPDLYHVFVGTRAKLMRLYKPKQLSADCFLRRRHGIDEFCTNFLVAYNVLN